MVESLWVDIELGDREFFYNVLSEAQVSNIREEGGEGRGRERS